MREAVQKKFPTLSCREIARHPSLHSGRRPIRHFVRDGVSRGRPIGLRLGMSKRVDSSLMACLRPQIRSRDYIYLIKKNRQMLLASTFYPKISYSTERNTLLQLEEMDSVKDGLRNGRSLPLVRELTLNQIQALLEDLKSLIEKLIKEL